ncbi:MAG: hypothetical protein NC037_02550 [Bacteroides sp.]|nr:hypothetical protein [Bacillota bacterium]MCM1455393.1 hypothetical protein [Bacteroides sp.]
MKKKLIKIICFGLALIMSVGILCACNNDDDFRNPRNGEPEAGEFYTLQQAYDNGWLSKGDLRNIAYYWSGGGQRKGFKPTPKNPETLSPETELAIKEDRAENLHESGTEEAVADGVKITNYFGTYDGLVAVFVYDNYSGYSTALTQKQIGGVSFKYYDSNQILVWKSNENN